MKRRKRQIKIFFSSIFALAALFCIFYLTNYQKPSADTNVSDQIATTATASPETTTPLPEITPPSPATETVPVETSPNVPIVMYHHIRTFTDTSDQIGFNLSVPPEKFESQLDYLQAQGYQTINFSDITSKNIPAKPVILTFDDGYENFYQNAYPALKKRGMTATLFAIVRMQGGDYMTPDQLKEISANGIEVGSHTLSHPDLAQASSEKSLQEITESKADLEAIIGKKITSFCYPAGKYNANTITQLQSAGYTYAVTTKSGLASFKNPFELNRYRMNNDTSIKAYLK